MKKSNKAAKSALIIMTFSLGSKFLGFIRETLIANRFGSGMETDAFFAALTATGLLTNLISVAIGTTFIPVLSEIEAKEGKEGKINHTNNMINILLVLSIVLSILGILAAPLIVKLLAKGFESEQYYLAIKLTRIGLPMLIFSSLMGALTGFLQSEQRHTSTAAIGIPFNMVYIFFLLFLSKTFGIVGLMVAAVLAVLGQLLILIPESKVAGYKYSFIFDIKDKYIIRVLWLSVPVLLGVAISDLNAIIDRRIASTLQIGSISALSYANKLNGLILGVFISAIATVIYPILSKEANEDNMEGVKESLGYGVNLIILITIPATIGLITLAEPIVRVAFERGKFDAAATLMTSKALVFYSVGLIGAALRVLLARTFYSLQDTKTPMINGTISIVVNVVLNLILVNFLSHGGLALGTSIANIVATALLFYSLRKRIGNIGTKSYIKCGLKAGLASSIMGISVYFIYNRLMTIPITLSIYEAIVLCIAVGIGVIIYGILSYMLGIEEIKMLVDEVKLRISKSNRK
ncbi:murein biosynthesis integral membrane protein MurJ [Wansuia hejianensis]|uniref:Probable lipid II flippase MurJ n=1 Tax=Wansuia hejianensis TaxID=2763667 RepID=A0A926IMZ6_9FIRM|nr:murein biosynthesis integral membrane protein MurJ [Wansuia hejianensis]MBC8590173.1 murein biosynthesis integral membrane protein MurJ [Wansuia hejianensis]